MGTDQHWVGAEDSFATVEAIKSTARDGMDNEAALEWGELSSEDLGAIAQAIHASAQTRKGNSLALLALLRLLEQCHREIRDSLFQASLPDNRQALYALLKDIEASGGWPYIRRMRLRALIDHVLAESTEISPETWSDNTDSSTNLAEVNQENQDG